MTTATDDLKPITDDPSLAGVLRGDLLAWTETAQESLLDAARCYFETIIQPGDLEAISLDDINPLKPPLGRQVELIRAGRWCLAHKEPFNIIAEAGSGKTKMTSNLTQMEILKAKRKGERYPVLVICPGHLIEKWIREYTDEFDAAAKWAVKQGWFKEPPKLYCLVAHHMADLNPCQRKISGKVHPMDADIVLCTYEDISLSHRRAPAYHVKPMLEEDGSIAYRSCSCPRNPDGTLDGVPPCCPGHYRYPNQQGPVHYCGRHHGSPIMVLACPTCGSRQYIENKDKTKTYLRPEEYGNSWRICTAEVKKYPNDSTTHECGAPLWQASAKPLPVYRGPGSQPLPGQRLTGLQDVVIWASRVSASGSRKMALAEYIKRHVMRFFQFKVTVVDEVHEAKSGESARGQAAGTLLQAATQSQISLTATTTGGYASSVFFLGQRTWPNLHLDFGYKELTRFVNVHGTYLLTFDRGEGPKPDEVMRNVGVVSDRKLEGAYGRPKKKEMPGLSPAAYIYFLSHAGFALVNEIFKQLPPYHEHVWDMPLDDTQKVPLDIIVRNRAGGVTLEKYQELMSQEEAYKLVEGSLRDIMLAALQAGSRRYLSIYFQNALRYQNIPTVPLKIEDPETGVALLEVSAFPEDMLFPKEERTIDAVVNGLKQGTKTLIYVNHVHAPDVAGRLYQVLTKFGSERLGRPLRVLVLRAGQIKRQDREAYLKRMIYDEDYEVLICSPQLVDTGLDLVWARQIIWYQQITSVYTMSQASRRSWRPGVEGEVNVNFALYQGTTEMLVAQLMAKKLRVHALMSGSGQYAAFTRDLSGAMDLTTMLAEQLGSTARSLFVDVKSIQAELGPIIVLKDLEDDLEELPLL